MRRLVALVALVGAASSPGPVDTSDRLTRTVHLTPGTPIRVDATIAELTIAGSNRTDVLVDIVRHAPSAADLAKYPALVDQRPDALHISAVQANDGRDAKLKADIAISAPVEAVFQGIRGFEGSVRGTNLKAGGDVRLRAGGDVGP